MSLPFALGIASSAHSLDSRRSQNVSFENQHLVLNDSPTLQQLEEGHDITGFTYEQLSSPGKAPILPSKNISSGSWVSSSPAIERASLTQSIVDSPSSSLPSTSAPSVESFKSHNTDSSTIKTLENWEKAYKLYLGLEFGLCLYVLSNIVRDLVEEKPIVDVLRQLTQPKSMLARLWFNIGIVRAFLGEHFLAVTAFQQSVKADPKFALARYALGISRFELREFRKSARAFLDAMNVLDVMGATIELLQRTTVVTSDGQKGSSTLGSIAVVPWELRRTRIEWNARVAIFEKLWKAKRVARPGGGGWGINGVPMGVFFVPDAVLVGSIKFYRRPELSRRLPAAKSILKRTKVRTEPDSIAPKQLSPALSPTAEDTVPPLKVRKRGERVFQQIQRLEGTSGPEVPAPLSVKKRHAHSQTGSNSQVLEMDTSGILNTPPLLSVAYLGPGTRIERPRAVTNPEHYPQSYPLVTGTWQKRNLSMPANDLFFVPEFKSVHVISTTSERNTTKTMLARSPSIRNQLPEWVMPLFPSDVVLSTDPQARTLLRHDDDLDGSSEDDTCVKKARKSQKQKTSLEILPSLDRSFVLDKSSGAQDLTMDYGPLLPATTFEGWDAYLANRAEETRMRQAKRALGLGLQAGNNREKDEERGRR